MIINNRSKETQFRDIAILARINTLPKSVIKELNRSDIPMVLKNNVNLFNDSSTKDLLTAVASTSDIKPQRGWDKKINLIVWIFKKIIRRNKLANQN